MNFITTAHQFDFTNYQCPPDEIRNAKIAIIGEGPNLSDIVQRRNFSGKSGQLLWSILAEQGIQRTDCYASNVMKNDMLRTEIPAYDPQWLSLLQAELREVQPNVVFALGAIALNALCNYDKHFNRINTKEMSIMSWRGSVLPCTLVPGLKVLSSVAPTAVMRQWKWRVYLATDVRKLTEQVKFGEIRTTEQTIHIFPSFKDSIEFLNDINGPYATDVEIQNGELACVGFAPSNTEAMCIPITQRDLTSYWSEEQELALWKAMASRLASPIPSIGQNYVFEIG